MTIIIVGETHIHCDRINVVDGHMIECTSKIDRAARAFVRRLSRLWGNESNNPCVSVPLH